MHRKLSCSLIRIATIPVVLGIAGGTVALTQARPTRSLPPVQSVPSMPSVDCTSVPVSLPSQALTTRELDVSPSVVGAQRMLAPCLAKTALMHHLVVTSTGASIEQFNQLVGAKFPTVQIAMAQRKTQIELPTESYMKAGHKLTRPAPESIAQIQALRSQARTTLSPLELNTNQGASTPYLAAQLAQNGQLHIYEGFAATTPDAKQGAEADFHGWVTRHIAGDYSPVGPDPTTIPANQWTTLFTYTISWTDGFGWTHTFSGSGYRMNEFGDGDWYTLASEFVSTNKPAQSPSNPNGYHCAWSSGNGQGWCGPLLYQRSIAYLSPTIVSPSQYAGQIGNVEGPQPNSTITNCSESFTTGTSFSSSVGVGFNSSGPTGGVTSGEGISQSNGVSCGSGVASISFGGTPSAPSWQENFLSLWAAQPSPTPPPVEASGFTSDQGEAIQVPEGTESISSGFTASTDTNGGTVWCAGIFCWNWYYTNYDWITNLSVTFFLNAPIFEITPTQFQVCQPAADTTESVQTMVTSFIPDPGAQSSADQLETYYDSSGGVSTNTGWNTLSPSTPVVNPGGLDWLPGAFDSKSLSFGPSGFTATTPTPWTINILPGIVAGSKETFWVSTNPTSAAPSEDQQTDPTAANTPNGFQLALQTLNAPIITSISTSSAPPGQPITIKGSGFMSGSEVQFGNYAPVAPASLDPNGAWLTVVPPLGSGTVSVVVISSCGQSAPASSGAPSPQIVHKPDFIQPNRHTLSNLLYTFWPNVTGVTPGVDAGFSPMTVKVTGNGFNNASALSIGPIVSADPNGTWVQTKIPANPPFTLKCLGNSHLVAQNHPLGVYVTTPVGSSPNNSASVFTLQTMGCSGYIPQVPGSCQGGRCSPDVSVPLTPSMAALEQRFPGLLAGLAVPRVPPHGFCPACTVNRTQFAQSFQRVLNLRGPSQRVDFKDVAASDGASTAIQATAPFLGFHLTARGFVFDPMQPVTRLDAAIAAVKVLVSQGKLLLASPAITQKVFQHIQDASSVPISSQPYAATAIQAGLMRLDAAARFSPQLPLDHTSTVFLLAQTDKLNQRGK